MQVNRALYYIAVLDRLTTLKVTENRKCKVHGHMNEKSFLHLTCGLVVIIQMITNV